MTTSAKSIACHGAGASWRTPRSWISSAGTAGGTSMKRRRLGRTGLVVSEICLGTMTFGNQADERTSLAILDRAYDAGVDFLDVAEVYPVPPDRKYAGRSEEIVGKWMQSKSRDAVFIATKVAGPGAGWFLAPVRAGKTSLDRHHIERAV